MNQAVSVPQISPMPVTPPERVVFTGPREEFRRLSTRGALLEFVTLGFYRFWLNTDIRRHLWSHTVVAGDAPEYTGRARELLIGFLIAMAILIPIYLGYFLLSLEAERIQAFASVPLVLFTYLFGQFAVYRARRYRMTRTVWRGVRFWMTGSGWNYAFRAFGWGILVVLTLGLALPWQNAALERYKMRHSHYGSVQGEFVGRGWDFFKRGWWIWLVTMAILAMAIAVPLVTLFSVPWVASDAAITELMNQVGGALTISFLLLGVLSPFLYGAYKSIQWRWWLEGIRFGGVAVQSDLRRGALIGLYWKVIGWMVLLGVIVAAIAAVITLAATALTGRTSAAIASDPVVAGLLIVAYLVYVVAINVVLRLYLIRDLWQRIATSATVSGLDSVRDVAAKGELAGSLGEGLADGLDVGGF